VNETQEDQVSQDAVGWLLENRGEAALPRRIAPGAPAIACASVRISRRSMLRLGLGVCAAAGFGEAVWAQEDPLDKAFGQPMYVVHLSWTNTLGGRVDKDGYMLFPEQPKDGILVTPDGSGGTFTNGAELIGGPFNTLREACGAVRGNAKASQDLGCPQQAESSKKPPTEDGEGLLGWVFHGGRKRFNDGWEAMTGRESGGLERVAGGVSILGAGAETVLLATGIAALARWAAGRLAARRAAQAAAREAARQAERQAAARLVPEIAKEAGQIVSNLPASAISEGSRNAVRRVIERMRDAGELVTKEGATEQVVQRIRDAAHLADDQVAALRRVVNEILHGNPHGPVGP
jgi:hypothetical protein